MSLNVVVELTQIEKHILTKDNEREHGNEVFKLGLLSAKSKKRVITLGAMTAIISWG